MSLVTLDQVADVNPRDTAMLKGLSTQDVAFLPMDAVSEEGHLSYQERRPLSSVLKGYTTFKRGDVLVAKITPCMENGKAAYLDGLETEVGAGSTEFHVLRPKNSIDGRYLFYLIWNPHFRHLAQRRMTGSAGQKRVPTDFLKSLQIPLPNLEEQRRIATILDKADAIRRKRQQALTLADDFLCSTFLEMFGDPVANPKGWDFTEFGEAVVHSNNGLSRRRKIEENVGQIVLRIQDIQQNVIRLNNPNRIELDASESKRFILDPDDLLFVRVNGNREYVGRCAVFEGHREPVAHNDHIIRIKLNKRVNPYFASYLFNLEAGKKLLSSAVKTSAGQYTVSQDGIEKVMFPMPPQDLQEKFQKMFTYCEEFKSSLARAYEVADRAFATLSQRAFRGEL